MKNSNHKISEYEMIEVLNTSAKDFYNFKTNYNFLIRDIKITIMTLTNLIERTIRGTFNCDILLKNADSEQLHIMFPYACSEQMFNISDERSILEMSRTLSGIRNLNAHYLPGTYAEEFFIKDFSHLKKAPKFNPSIDYYRDDITLAGIVFILFCFSREKMIKDICLINPMFGLIASGSSGKENCERFVKEISHSNFECDIRRQKGTDLLSSIVGEYESLLQKEDEVSIIKIGSPRHPSFLAKFIISEGSVIIKKDSLMKNFYSNDYSLKIKEMDSFISYSNQLPPFVFIDYLYSLNITTFDKLAVSTIEKNLFLMLKLNKPKFYVDKSLDILLYGNKNADIRLVSAAINTVIMQFIMLLAGNIIQNNNLRRYKYIDFYKILKKSSMPEELIKNTINLRNFAFHGYSLNDIRLNEDSVYQYNFEFINRTIIDILNFFKETNTTVYNSLTNNISNSFIATLVSAKYKVARKDSFNYLEYPTKENLDILQKSIKWIQASGFNINDLYELQKTIDDIPRIIELLIKDLPYHLYFFNSYKDNSIINDYIKENDYIVLKKENNKLIENVFISKKEDKNGNN